MIVKLQIWKMYWSNPSQSFWKQNLEMTWIWNIHLIEIWKNSAHETEKIAHLGKMFLHTKIETFDEDPKSWKNNYE